MPAPPPAADLADRLVAVLADGAPRTTGELAAVVGVDRLGVVVVLERLKGAGRIVEVGIVAAPRRWGGRQPSVLWRLAASG